MNKEQLINELSKALALVSKLVADDRAYLPSGLARTAYARELRLAISNLNRLKKEFKNPQYKKLEPKTPSERLYADFISPSPHKREMSLKTWQGEAVCVVFALQNLPKRGTQPTQPTLDAPSQVTIRYLLSQKYHCTLCDRDISKKSKPSRQCFTMSGKYMLP